MRGSLRPLLGVAMLVCGLGTAAAASDSSGYLHSAFQETYARAQIGHATTLGGAYDQSLREGRTADTLAAMFKACVRQHPQPAAAEYLLVGFVLQDGRMVNTQVAPADELGICFARAVAGLAFPPPPARYVPCAVALRFDGRTLQQLSAFPSAEAPPPPPAW
ncbi:hypothetical protein J7I44_07795 [Frateuria sp. MAH-13]|uniref:TonB C-terminal domain-containing protein n=1 Tax=Frateuria flava TaxID=2821489 RepID=A0ABS4DMD6_9GAMM|nr:hypothetical protein [Frateuria flava]MBP1474197.1 hypothetical protein [Frateuria flava]